MALRMFWAKAISLSVLPDMTFKSDNISLMGERHDKSQEIMSFSNERESLAEMKLSLLLPPLTTDCKDGHYLYH